MFCKLQDNKNRRKIYETTWKKMVWHPAHPRADTGLDAGDEFDGVCGWYNIFRQYYNVGMGGRDYDTI
jgi:hypothetical protein